MLAHSRRRAREHVGVRVCRPCARRGCRQLDGGLTGAGHLRRLSTRWARGLGPRRRHRVLRSRRNRTSGRPPGRHGHAGARERLEAGQGLGMRRRLARGLGRERPAGGRRRDAHRLRRRGGGRRRGRYGLREGRLRRRRRGRKARRGHTRRGHTRRGHTRRGHTRRGGSGLVRCRRRCLRSRQRVRRQCDGRRRDGRRRDDRRRDDSRCDDRRRDDSRCEGGRRLRRGRRCLGPSVTLRGRLARDRRRGYGRLDGRRRSGRRRGGGRCRRVRSGRRRRGSGNGRREHRQEPDRVEVALRVGGRADAEMDVRPRNLGRAARAHGPDDRTLDHRRVARDDDRAEMRERHGEAVGRLDRDRPAARRHGARKGHDARHGREHRRAVGRGDIDAAVLPRSVRMGAVEGEAVQHGPADGPRPRARGRNPQHKEEDEQNDSSHAVTASVVSIVNDESTLAAASGCCQI